MKLTLTYIFSLIVLVVSSQDTIEVSVKNTSYITFPSDISYFDIGMPEYFIADIGQGIQVQKELNESFDGKLLKLKCLKPTNEISSLMIKFGDKYELINLKYSNSPKILHYKMYQDLNKRNSSIVQVETNTKNIIKKDIGGSDNQRIKVLCDSMINIKNELKEYGFIDSYLQAAVTAIRNDDKNTYLKIAIQNKSSIPYRFDFISFQYVQKLHKGVFKSKKKSPQDVFPVQSPSFESIPANTGKFVSYAIPQFGLANNGYLLVLFREKNGDRILKISIPSDVIQGSQHFK